MNDRSQWEEVHVPDLRIVEQPLWDAAKAPQAEAGFRMGRDEDGRALNRAHRAAFLLSGGGGLLAGDSPGRRHAGHDRRRHDLPPVRAFPGTSPRRLLIGGERVTTSDGLRIELEGDLAMILALASPGGGPDAAGRARNEKLPRTCVLGSQLSVVAGTGFEPVTFRL